MALKFVLVVALACMSQALARGPLYDARPPCKPASESAEEIVHEFEETMLEMDDLRDSVSTAIMDSYSQNADIGVIIACFREQKGPYVALGQRLANMMEKAVKELAKDLGDKYEKFAKRAEVPMRNIANTVRSLPGKMWELIKNQEFGKAMELMKESRRIVEENAKELAKIMRELRQELPEVADKAEKLAKEIREEARKGNQKIAEDFKKCVEAGGPNPTPKPTPKPTPQPSPKPESDAE